MAQIVCQLEELPLIPGDLHTLVTHRNPPLDPLKLQDRDSWRKGVE